MRIVADGLEDPWEVTWGPVDHLWITERTARRVLRVNPLTGERAIAVTIEEAIQMLGQDGLPGLALHPGFGRGRSDVYVMYTYDADSGSGIERRGKIRRYTFDPETERLVNPVDVLSGIPHGPDHGGSRIVFGPDGQLYSSEHGQDTDDEVNRIVAGRNYGWPLIAGYRDDKYYAYAVWADSSPTACSQLSYERVAPASVPRIRESDVEMPDFAPPLMTFFTVPSTFDPAELGNATAALTGIDVYVSSAIPGWNPSLLVASMVSGVVFRIPLERIPERPLTYFRTQNRYRDLAIAPDGRRIYAVTTPYGRTLDEGGTLTGSLANPGALLEFTFDQP
ncbi:MAG: PQQ-dependent sugar dehydrogenase [Gammaproteobacteria bacterium]